MNSRLVSLLGSNPHLTSSKSADGPGFLKGRYLKDILILNSFSFEDKEPGFTQAKTKSCTKVTK